ncbi:MAG TPA: FAD-dependent monooxygenase, partial [Novosphingobium sp.]|nr:FAD-dependent monooxygenase [Novosphingobium sp.]
DHASAMEAYDRQRRTVTHTFTQNQTIENMAYIKGGSDEAHRRRREAMLAIKADDEKRRSYLLRQAMYESLSQAAAVA